MSQGPTRDVNINVKAQKVFFSSLLSALCGQRGAFPPPPSGKQALVFVGFWSCKWHHWLLSSSKCLGLLVLKQTRPLPKNYKIPPSPVSKTDRQSKSRRLKSTSGRLKPTCMSTSYDPLWSAFLKLHQAEAKKQPWSDSGIEAAVIFLIRIPLTDCRNFAQDSSLFPTMQYRR